LHSGLFDEETQYTLYYAYIDNVKTSTKSIIRSLGRKLELDHITFSNIFCNGDKDDSSIIYYDSGDTLHEFIIKSATLKDSKTNGALVKISGDNNIIKFRGFKVDNTSSYGQVIENISRKVCSVLFIIFIFIFI